LNSQIGILTEAVTFGAGEPCSKGIGVLPKTSRESAVDAAAFFMATIDYRWTRLPPPGKRCEWSGLSRTGLNALILPSKDNSFRPPVKSISSRKPGQRKATRQINLGSLLSYLDQQALATAAAIVSASRGHNTNKKGKK